MIYKDRLRLPRTSNASSLDDYDVIHPETEVEQVVGLSDALGLKAPLASPALTGTPTSTTPETSDNSTKIATTAYVKSNLNSYLPLSGGTINGNLKVTGTLKKGDIDVSLEGHTHSYLPLSGGTMTGHITLPSGVEIW